MIRVLLFGAAGLALWALMRRLWPARGDDVLPPPEQPISLHQRGGWPL